MSVPRPGRRTGTLVAVLAAMGVLAAPAWMWQASRLPPVYGAAHMGEPDLGGGTPHAHAVAERSVTSFEPPPDQVADVSLSLVARAQEIELGPDRVVDGYTLNGTSPGPEIRVVEGQLVQVRLVNESVPGGATLHWHGVDVPNATDGVAGVTQDAVPVGGEHVYRFVAEQVGTYWYHSHQLSHEQVRRGLLGALVVEPAGGTPAPDEPASDAVALVHMYEGVRTVNGRPGEVRHVAEPGARARVRVINTDNGPMSVWVSGAPFRLLAVDGTDVSGPSTVSGVAVQVTAGARADIEVQTPADGSGARVELGGATALVVGPEAARPVPSARPSKQLDPLSYGTPEPLDLAGADRTFEYRIGRRPGFLDGRPGLWWTVNGRMFPDVPMFMVSEGVQRQRRGPPHASARPPRRGARARRCRRDRQPLVGGLPRGGRRRDVRPRLRRGQPGDLDGPLPQPPARGAGARRAPHVRGGQHALPAGWGERAGVRCLAPPPTR